MKKLQCCNTCPSGAWPQSTTWNIRYCTCASPSMICCHRGWQALDCSWEWMKEAEELMGDAEGRCGLCTATEPRCCSPPATRCFHPGSVPSPENSCLGFVSGRTEGSNRGQKWGSPPAEEGSGTESPPLSGGCFNHSFKTKNGHLFQLFTPPGATWSGSSHRSIGLISPAWCSA